MSEIFLQPYKGGSPTTYFVLPGISDREDRPGEDVGALHGQVNNG